MGCEVVASRGGTDNTMTGKSRTDTVTVDEPLRRPAVRCHARRTNGEPCGNFAMHGSRVCHAHGGKAPAVRNAAEKRMVEAALLQEVGRFIQEDRAKREALAPWSRELGLQPLWRWHSPNMLRRIATEMRSVADELCALAEQRSEMRTE